jgi:hypothetical protein
MNAARTAKGGNFARIKMPGQTKGRPGTVAGKKNPGKSRDSQGENLPEDRSFSAIGTSSQA